MFADAKEVACQVSDEISAAVNGNEERVNTYGKREAFGPFGKSGGKKSDLFGRAVGVTMTISIARGGS